MQINIRLSGMALIAAILLIFASGCASSSQQLEQPAMTTHMKSVVGTPDELSPMAPAEARNLRKVRNQWMCDLNSQVIVYNDATGQWEPQKNWMLGRGCRRGPKVAEDF